MSGRYIDVMDTSFSTGIDCIFDNTIDKNTLFLLAESAREAGITNFEISSPARFAAIAQETQAPFEFIKRFRWIVGDDANLQIAVNSLNTVFNYPVGANIHSVFIDLAAESSVTTVSSYDPLNDMRNLDLISYLVKERQLLNEPVISLMSLPKGDIFGLDFYKKALQKMLDLGIEFDSILFKDELGHIPPAKFYDIVKMAKEFLGKDTFIRVSTRNSIGFGITSYLAAIEAGADGIDLAMHPFSGGISNPDILTMFQITKGMGYNFGDLQESKIVEHQKFLKEQVLSFKPLNDNKEVDALRYYNPLKVNIEDIDSSLVYEVIEAAGYAVPTKEMSKIYYNQARLNFLNKKWEKIDKKYAQLVLGYLGKSPYVADPEVVEIAEAKYGKKFTLKEAIECIEPSQKDYENKINTKKAFLSYYLEHLKKEDM